LYILCGSMTRETFKVLQQVLGLSEANSKGVW
jgi:hypothetical protein